MATTEPQIITDIVLLGVHEGAHATLLREYRCGPIRMTATPVGSEFTQEGGRLIARSIEFRGSTDGAKVPAARVEHIDVRIAGFVAEGATADGLLDPAGHRRTDDMQIALRLARDEVGPDAPDEEVGLPRVWLTSLTGRVASREGCSDAQEVPSGVQA